MKNISLLQMKCLITTGTTLPSALFKILFMSIWRDTIQMCLSPVDELKRDLSFESHIMIQKTSLNQTFNFYTPHCISAKRVYSTNIYEIFWLLPYCASFGFITIEVMKNKYRTVPYWYRTVWVQNIIYFFWRKKSFIFSFCIWRKFLGTVPVPVPVPYGTKKI